MTGRKPGPTEAAGFDTVDLKEAQALLAELA